MINYIRNLFAKRQTSHDRWIDASTRVIEGAGTHGAKPWPFDFRHAVVEYRSWVYRCALGNAQRAASVPLRLYIRDMDGKQLRARGLRGPAFATRKVPHHRKKWLMGEYYDTRPAATTIQKIAQLGDEFVEVTDAHPVMELLSSANEMMNGFNLATYRHLFQELTGNAYLHPVMSDELDRPIALYPMFSQWVWVIPADDDDTRLIDGYAYGVQSPKIKDFEPDEVLAFQRPNPKDLFYGMGKVEAAWDSLGLHRSQRVMQKALFDNHARPDYLISIEGGGQESVTGLKKEVNKLMRGVRNAGRFLAASGKVNVTPLSWQPDQLGTTEEVVEEIAGVFGYPITKLKANDPNRANAETGDAGWLMDTIHPMLVQDEEALNQNGYLGLFGRGSLLGDAVLAYDNPLPENAERENVVRVSMVGSAGMTPNEYRERSGLAPVDDPNADKLYLNGQPLDKINAEQPAGGFGGFGGLFGLSSSGGESPATPASEPKPPAPVAGFDSGEMKRMVMDAVTEVLNAHRSAGVNGDHDLAPVQSVADRGPDGGDAAGVDRAAKRKAEDHRDDDDRPAVERGGERADDAISGDAVAGVELTGSPSPVESATIKDANETGRPRQADAAADDLREGRDGEGSLPDEPASKAADTRTAEGVGVHDCGHCGVAEGAEAVSHTDLAMGLVKCDHHHGDSMPINFKGWTKASETGDAEDTVRDGEAETPIDRLANAINEVLDEMARRVFAFLSKTKSGKVRQKIRANQLPEMETLILEMRSVMVDAVTPHLREILAAGGIQAIERLAEQVSGLDLGGDPFSVTNPKVAEAARTFAERLASSVTQTTATRISETLAQGLDAGENIADLSRRVEQTGVFDPNRAEMIARSESARAYVEGEIEAWEETGVVEGKQWLLAPEACEFCEAIAREFNDKTVGLRESFYKQGATLTGVNGGVMKLDYGDLNGPPAHPHCRCDVLAVL